MSEIDARIDEIVRTLVRDVAAGVHAMYRGDMRQQTTQLKLSTFAKQASDKIRVAVASGVGAPTPAGAMVAIGGNTPSGPFAVMGSGSPALSEDEISALTRCIMAWMPVGGAPNSATPEMKCRSGAVEMCPTWGEREAARTAVRRLSS